MKEDMEEATEAAMAVVMEVDMAAVLQQLWK